MGRGPGRNFSTRRGTTRVVFGRGTAAELVAHMDAPPSRIAVVATPGRKADASLLAARLGARSGGVIALAREHVPVETVAEARAAVEGAGVTGLLAFGGGSSIGLAKAVAVTTTAT